MDTISLLLNRGVDIFTLDNEGYMPIDLAKDNDHEECTRLLFHAKTTSLLVSNEIFKKNISLLPSSRRMLIVRYKKTPLI